VELLLRDGDWKGREKGNEEMERRKEGKGMRRKGREEPALSMTKSFPCACQKQCNYQVDRADIP